MKKALGWAARLGIALAVFTGALLGTAGAASAAPLEVSAPVAASYAVPAIVPMADGDEVSISPDESVIMFRWMNGTQNFNFQVDGDPVAAMSRATQRTMFYTLPMSIGNGMWSGTSALLDGAVQFKPMQLVGAEVDAAAAGIGQAIIDSPLIAAAIVMLSFGTIFALKRGERPWRRVWTTAVVAGMFVVMVIGSRTSTGGNGEDYRPGVGSPGWFLTIVSTATAEITTSVAGSLSVPNFTPTDGYSCTAYVADIVTAGEQERKDAGKKLTSTAPMSSSLWMQTGMEAWKLAQFGSNIYTQHSYCHVLDWAYPKRAAAILDASGEWPTANANSAALSPQNGEQRDRSGIAWAVCRWTGDTWATRAAWFSDNAGTPTWGPPDTGLGNTWGDAKTAFEGTDGNCAKWWNDAAADWQSDKFKIGPNDGDIKHFMQQDVSTGTRDDVYNFLSNWHGTDSTGIIVTNTYVVSSLIISAAFLVVTAAIFFVNIAIVATMLSIFVVLLVVLFTKNDVESRLMSFVKNLLGLIVFSSVAALLIAMLAKIVEVLGSVGKSLFSDAPIAVMLWVGLSPLFALIMLHFIFTKLIKVPSPFKLSSALAWGSAAGAAGGAAGAGLAARGERAAERAAGQGIKKAGGAIADGAKGLISGKGRDGAASATDAKSNKGKQVAGASTASGADINESMSAKEIRAERKEALAAAKADLKKGDEEKKSTKFLSAADSLLGGGGTIAATTGWRGAVNKASNALGPLGQGDLLSNKDYSDKRSLATRLSEGGMARSAAVLTAAKTSISEGAAGYAEKWRNDPRAAIAQTIKTGAKYGALAVGTAATGGAVGAVYAGVKANQAVRNAGYAGVGLPGGSRQYQNQQVSAFQERKQQAAQAQAQQAAAAQREQAKQQAKAAAQAQRQQAQPAPKPVTGGQTPPPRPQGGQRPSGDAGI